MTGVAFAMTSVSGRLPCRMGVVSFASNVYQTLAGGLPFSTPHCLHTWRSFSDLKLKKKQVRLIPSRHPGYVIDVAISAASVHTFN